MADEKEVKQSGGGKGGFIVVVLLLALVGACAGAGFSMTFFSPGATADHGKPAAVAANAKQNAAAGKTGDASAAGSKAPAKRADDVPKENVVSIDPILITLAGSQKAWARVELGVIVQPTEGKEDQTPLLKAVSEDMMTYLRTVPLAHVETASGLEYLREDLSEIVQKRSKGRVRGVVLRSLVVE